MLVKKLLGRVSKSKNPLGSHLLEEVESEFNGKIQIYQTLGSKRITVGGLIQSGGVLANIWYKALSKLKSLRQLADSNLKTILILGLGGGTAASLTARFWPKAEITGIEIDPKMIQLGKKYFELDKLPQLKIVEGEAIEYVRNNNDKFDLILVDLYQGDKIVKKSESGEFIGLAKRRLKSKGIIIFNRLFYDDHKEKAEKFVKIIEKHFKKVVLVRAWSNLVVIGKK